jgi:transcription elongation GreA/GreB family factor
MNVNEKREKFRELAEKRVTRAIKDIRLIGNLANKNNYQYTDQDGAKICAALEAEIKSLRAKFSAEDSKQSHIFKL